MSHDYVLDRARGLLARGDERFEPWSLRWAPIAPSEPRPEGPVVSALEAVRWLHADTRVRRLPVAVIGPKEASARHLGTAERLGGALAQTGFTLLTGGRQGVMEAASRGAAGAGGLVLGLLPEETWRAANEFVAIPLASGIGPARNALIARAAFALVAVGGGYGTLSEIAFGMHFGRAVLCLEDAPSVPGAIPCRDVDEALARVAEAFLSLQ